MEKDETWKVLLALKQMNFPNYKNSSRSSLAFVLKCLTAPVNLIFWGFVFWSKLKYTQF